MRLVDSETLLAMPENTLFQTHLGGEYLGSLKIKGRTEKDEKGYVEVLETAINDPLATLWRLPAEVDVDGEELRQSEELQGTSSALFDHAAEYGGVLDMRFEEDWYPEEAFDEAAYVVWEQQDVLKLINLLSQCVGGVVASVQEDETCER